MRPEEPRLCFEQFHLFLPQDKITP